MYPLEWIERLKRSSGGAKRSRRIRDVSPVIWGLGITSFLTDISTEMVGSILPVYLVLHLHLSPLQFAAIDGIYNGLSVALVAVVAGVIADRSRFHKQVALVGYGLSALCKLGLVLAGGAWGIIMLVVGLDRLGKGIRTAPRDSIISFCSEKSALGLAFGVHRAMDSAGAFLGPLLAFVLLAYMSDAFDVLWLVSFVIALIGVAALALLVPFARRTATDPTVSSDRQHPVGKWLSPSLLRLGTCGSVLAVLTVSDGFLYLMLQERTQIAPGFVPLFYVGTALAYMVFAVPAGLLADRVGRTRIFVAGYALLLALYGLIYAFDSAGPGVVVICLATLGLYYAATEGVLMALASTVSVASSRTTALALIATSVGVGKLLSSILFGWLWQAYGVEAALMVFALAGLIAVVAVGLQLRPIGDFRVA